MTDLIKTTIKALEKNNMKAFYCESSADAVELVKSMMFKGATITRGGSESVKESGIFSLINNGDYRFLDRTRQGITKEEEMESYKETVGGDFYFCSANAVTKLGDIVNIDGYSNRISAIAFGPKKVIMIVGINKIVNDLDEAILRIKTVASPKNCVRLNKKTPCATLGKCICIKENYISKINEGCASPDRICRNVLISGPQAVKDRINVIIVNENLGY